MNVHRLLPLACLSLMLAAASPGEAHSPFESAPAFVSVPKWFRSFIHAASGGAATRLEPGDRDGSTATPITTWGRIKERFREGGPPPGGKD